MKTVLSIGAHPDDIEIGCGGTELLLKEQGYKLIHLIVTSGEEGSLSIPKLDLKNKREDEAKNAAALMGVAQIIFLAYPDGLTSFTKAMKIELISFIRKLKPEIIFTHASTDTFLDHQIINQLTRSAITAAQGPWYPEAAGAPHKVSKVYGYEVWHPLSQHQVSVCIDAVMEAKIAALKCHVSQIETVDYTATIKGLAAYRGVMTMKGSYAEVFEVICGEIV